MPQKNEEPKKSESKKPEAPKSLMQVAATPDNQKSQDSEFEKEFIDVDEDAEDDEQPKSAVN